MAVNEGVFFSLVGFRLLVVAEGGVVFWSGRLEQTGGCRGGAVFLLWSA